ncbi:hypothetical protein PIB30_057586 [Stylosanthes scabra]|uniref:GOLD domain-containing protein n=1 Tax=Stylosanthes scabra TaxID=79078 RepID=A0ABU6TLB3_9FABA|nr:hypothetical protein [Stylosanthes scabra]
MNPTIMFGSNTKAALPHLLVNNVGIIIALVIVLGESLCSVESFKFELNSGGAKCVAEDMKIHTMNVGKYDITNPNDAQPLPDSHRVNVRVTSIGGNTYHLGEKVASGQFSFVAGEAGDYIACFRAVEHDPPITLTIDFDWKLGVKTIGGNNVAKQSQVEIMVLQLKQMQESASSIREEMINLRLGQEKGEEFDLKSLHRIFLLSYISIFIILSVAGMQLMHLKRFFEKKKLI